MCCFKKYFKNDFGVCTSCISCVYSRIKRLQFVESCRLLSKKKKKPRCFVLCFFCSLYIQASRLEFSFCSVMKSLLCFWFSPFSSLQCNGQVSLCNMERQCLQKALVCALDNNRLVLRSSSKDPLAVALQPLQING